MANNGDSKQTQSTNPGTDTNLKYWDSENEEFWEEYGKSIATRNLWISIPNLLLGFAVWIIWSVVIVSIQSLHDADPTQFRFSDLGELTPTEYKVILYSLPAVAGLAGATLRIPNSFMISNSGGRNVIASTTLLLLLPMAALGIALQDPDVSFLTLIIIAAVSGVGGGAFASSMSNISFFFPKKVQGTSLGLNAGLGNVGVSVMQLLVPIVISVKLFGFLTGDGYSDGSDTVYIQNAGLVWVPLSAIFLLAAWFKMNNLPQHDVSDTKKALSKFFYLELIGFIAAGVGVTLLMVFYTDFQGEPSFILFALILVIISVTITLAMMRYGTQQEVQENLANQFKIFNNKHNWIMTWLYIMTFGSFIGF
ncbi:MAG: NarK/NasA family nitrate transporter, partial [Candidatus Heimdallarchaeota archaeon]|nr:NarK/NasA family nitrate transporter [Candidatus Heimdallarchaeota archaeon]